uniref:Uncharacterized protein n=1 Tax=Arundo donax TaxID=35708 RepID=A0A0A9BMT1_ARUDO
MELIQSSAYITCMVHHNFQTVMCHSP